MNANVPCRNYVYLNLCREKSHSPTFYKQANYPQVGGLNCHLLIYCIGWQNTTKCNRKVKLSELKTIAFKIIIKHIFIRIIFAFTLCPHWYPLTHTKGFSPLLLVELPVAQQLEKPSVNSPFYPNKTREENLAEKWGIEPTLRHWFPHLHPSISPKRSLISAVVC